VLKAKEKIKMTGNKSIVRLFGKPVFLGIQDRERILFIT
jgi:hypothetical protein